MALDLGEEEEENGLFNRSDVRETATDDLAGLNSPSYITLALDSKLLNERQITAGTGINFTDTGSNGTLTIAGDDASTSAKGVVQFNSDDFEVETGVVNLKTTGVVISVIAGEGVDVSGEAGDVTISGEYADHWNKGIANFEYYDFTVIDGTVTLKFQLRSWGIDGNSGTAIDDATSTIATDAIIKTEANNSTSGIEAGSNGTTIILPVNLPYASEVTEVKVRGNAGAQAKTWTLYRHTIGHTSASSAMASALVGVDDETISYETIINSNYTYWIEIPDLDAGDEIYGAAIQYLSNGTG